MKNAIIFGCGGKNGVPITDALCDQNYNIINVSSSVLNRKNVKNIQVEWNKIDIPFIHKTFTEIEENIDFIFFNQKSSSLTSSDFSNTKNNTMHIWQQIKNWSNSQWLSCQLPFLVLHTLKNKLYNESKVGWMLSSYIDHTRTNAEEYPDYSSYKFMNYLIMKNFGINSNFKTFGIIPDFNKKNSKDDLYNLVGKILVNDINSSEIFTI